LVKLQEIAHVMAQLRLLHIIATVDPESGGPIKGILYQNTITEPLGVIREIVSIDPVDAPFVKTFAIKTHALGHAGANRRKRSGQLARYGYTPKLIPWLRENVGKYDAVIVHGLWNYTTYAASVVLPDCGTPYFVFVHGMMDPWFRQRQPVKHWLKQAFWFFCEGPLLAQAETVLFTSKDECELARGVFHGYSYRERIVGYGSAGPPRLIP
jgi:hypothetical protein